jgi:hypothetical protein
MPLDAAYPATFRFLPIIRDDPFDPRAFADDPAIGIRGRTCSDSA